MFDVLSLSGVLQLLVAVSSHWNAVEGELYRYQRFTTDSPWELVGRPIAIKLGKEGMAWGRGILQWKDDEGLQKKEGDGRSPAGLFSLGWVFGDALHQRYARNMPFLLITEDLECVDDPGSKFYNQCVYAHTIAERDWKSSEKMQEIGPLYAIGIVVHHNCNPVVPGGGSAIFMHICSEQGKGTAGCTAMAEEDLITLVSWLDEYQNPRLLQLPMEEYEKVFPSPSFSVR
ncbi:MAG TPA: L,D-transpeptidase family protein [Rhabdochlamydiaceae bacterium]|jgi:D-alanyl-D-alanine dipeptidase